MRPNNAEGLPTPARGWKLAVAALGALIGLLVCSTFAAGKAASRPHPTPLVTVYSCPSRSPVTGVPLGRADAASAAAAARTDSHVASPYATTFGIATFGELQNYPFSAVRKEMKAAQVGGASWMRINVNWATIQDHGRRSFNWYPVDRLVKEATACGLQVLGTIDYTPRWARPRNTPADWGPNPATFARFAAAAAAHYARLGVHAYEVWNEPNEGPWWAPRPNARAYTRLLRAAYVAIHRADPQATVVSGGLSPAPTDPDNISPYDFTKRMYLYGAKGYFDALGDHPFTWPGYPGETQVWNPWYQMVGARQSVRNVMVANGDAGKLIWATEFGAATGGAPGSYVSYAKQSAIVRRGMKLWIKYPWAGPMFLYSSRDEPGQPLNWETHMGLVDLRYHAKPAFSAFSGFIAAIRARLGQPSVTLH